MLLKSLVKPKERLTTVREDATLEEALKILEDSGFRCVPILDETGQLFRGNIYKMHIYRHKSRGGDMSLPVTTLLKNATKFISVNSAFFNVFFSIKDLPYITVLDDNNHFYGILTHARLLDMLSQSWNVNVGSYVLTVVSIGERGDLASMAKIITKYTSISSVMSLDAQGGELVHRTLFTLPSDVGKKKLDRIVDNLERKEFRVPEIEDLQSYDHI
ncbi:cyclic di-AMP binding protein CbpA [Pediococcus inopinatus]|jgi:CBS domain-containing protein|uniref:Cyclic di-AMP binding protein CbpA n=1 Tax=Pediococcus inopinatus TaxID=114090 RepID=A0ABZ0Q421_9LACO|nr:cyclic di-AMP binding protein CbpA [Pediococcus inopinatus]WPC18180.1 cyclic di-AMP binding protein CbpA [Pediococcus inopinatus]WPC19723.1 cyclic di-AMP binding protein CbpA [Pediococcus inopinatus]WPC21419.1 cyclic di-AMP binding protein CbpA [Pediococcus inopinatus]WPP09638.1 cyclic di-AMP binding protein CbpA [Pediococcus inopinatus]